jgi:hypothetical protein
MSGLTLEQLRKCKAIIDAQEIDTSTGVYVIEMDRCYFWRKVRAKRRGKRICYVAKTQLYKRLNDEE